MKESEPRNPPPSVGTKLHELFSHIVTGTDGCNCADIAAKMDRLGPKLCRENVNQLASEVRNSALKWKNETNESPWKGRAECNSDLLQNILNKSVAVLPLPPAAVFRMLILHACDLVEAAEPEGEKVESEDVS